MMSAFASAPGRSLLSLTVALLATGCATTPLPRYKPSLAEVNIPADHRVAVQMLVSFASVPADKETGAPAGLEARIRLENHTDTPARIEADSLELVGTNLGSFPPPQVSPPRGLELAPGERGLLTARFPYPVGEGPGSGVLESVNLRWTVDVAGRSYTHSLTFERREPRVTYHYSYYPGPWAAYWGPGWYDTWTWGTPVIVEEHDVDPPHAAPEPSDRD